MFFMCCILAGAVLKIAAAIILPFTLAVLLAFVMYPIVKKLDKLRFPRFLSIILVVILMITVLIGLGIVLYFSGKTVASFLPQYFKEDRLNEIYLQAARIFDLSYDEELTFINNLWAQLGIRTWVRNSSVHFMNIFLRFMKSAGLVVIFVVFILVEANFFKDKLIIALKDNSERINRMGHDLMSNVARYLGAKFLISLANGLLFAITFYFVGLEFAIVWGILQFILNFIPTLGSIVAGFLISLFALLQFWPEPGPIILVIAIILVSNIVLGNFLDPKIIGEHVGISPLMVLISLLLWGWIWGFAGMVIAVPMTLTIKIICENIPFLEPVSVLIGVRKAAKEKKAKDEKPVG